MKNFWAYTVVFPDVFFFLLFFVVFLVCLFCFLMFSHQNLSSPLSQCPRCISSEVKVFLVLGTSATPSEWKKNVHFLFCQHLYSGCIRFSEEVAKTGFSTKPWRWFEKNNND